MNRLVLFVLSAAAASAVGAPAPVVKPEHRGDRDRLQGEWVVVSTQEWFHDNLCRRRTDLAATVLISGDRHLWREKGREYSGVIRLDPAANPKAIDLRRADSRRVWKGIYKLQGNVLTIRIGFDERPESFSRNGCRDEERVLRRNK